MSFSGRKFVSKVRGPAALVVLLGGASAFAIPTPAAAQTVSVTDGSSQTLTDSATYSNLTAGNAGSTITGTNNSVTWSGLNSASSIVGGLISYSGGTIDLTGATISATGSGPGYSYAAIAEAGGTIHLTGGTLAASGTNISAAAAFPTGSVTLDNVAVTTSGLGGAIAVYVEGSAEEGLGTVTLNNTTLNLTGVGGDQGIQNLGGSATMNGGSITGNMFATNAVLVEYGGNTTLSGTNITFANTGQSSTKVLFAGGEDGGTINFTGGTISLTSLGASPVIAQAQSNSVINITDSALTATGSTATASAGGVQVLGFNDLPGGIVNISNSTLNVSNSNGLLISPTYVGTDSTTAVDTAKTGSINVTNNSKITVGGTYAAAYINAGGTLTVDNSTISATGTATNSVGVTVNDGTLISDGATITAATSPAIVLAGNPVVNLTDTAVNGGVSNAAFAVWPTAAGQNITVNMSGGSATSGFTSGIGGGIISYIDRGTYADASLIINASNGAALNGNVVDLPANATNGAGTDVFLTSGATWTGATTNASNQVSTAAAARTVGVGSGSTWTVTANSTVTNTLTNSGTVAINGFNTLTVGNYVGNGGTLAINTQLGNDSSPTGLLVINGGTATGSTTVQVTNVGGQGAQTGTGIKVVGSTNGGTTNNANFTLAGYVAAGAYEYTLVYGGDQN